MSVKVCNRNIIWTIHDIYLGNTFTHQSHLYLGTHCEETNDCVPNPCQNYGYCDDHDGPGYTCLCYNIYTGRSNSI